MAVDQKIAIRSIFILADTRLCHRRIRQPRHSLRQILTHRLQSTGSNNPLATIRIKLFPMRIDRELEPTPFDIGHRINKIVEIDPRRHHARIETVVSRRHTEKDHFLPRYMNQLTKQIRKQLRQPWSTRKYKLPGG